MKTNIESIKDSNIQFASVCNETLEKLLLEKDALNRRRAKDVAVRVFMVYLNEKRLDTVLLIK